MSGPSRGEEVRAVSLPVLAGLLVRAIPVATADFPLNDGGLFFAMTQDLQAAGYALPASASYNGLGIPFAYPPLALYMAGLLSDVIGVALLDLFRLLPLLFTTLTIPAVYLVAREILPTRFQAIVATWAFALLPRAFDWSLAGGGITRSLGVLLATLAILAGVRFYRSGRRSHGAATAVLTGLTVVSHPGAGLFLAISLVLLFLAYGRNRRALVRAVLVALGAVVVSAPWWLSVVARHGIAPLFSGGQTGLDIRGTFQGLVTLAITDEPYAAFLAVVGLIGFVYNLARRSYLLPAWIVVTFTIDTRAATPIMLPVAMLIAVAVDQVLLASVRPAGGERDDELWPSVVTRDAFGRVILAAGLVLGVAGAVRASTWINSPLHALAPANRDAMAWIRDNVEPGADFLVIDGSRWFLNAEAEWFPVLSGHRSLNTVQGYEWLGKGAWDDQTYRDDQLQRCAYSTAECVERWTAQFGAANAWLYVPGVTLDTLAPNGDCCAGLRESLAGSGAYTVAYESAGGAVFRPTR